MGAFIIDQNTSLLSCLDQAVTTRALLAAYSHTASLATDFDAWLAKWKTVYHDEIDLRIETTSAAAAETAVDEDLNDLSDETSKTTLITTKGNRSDPEFVFYFKNKRPSDFKKPLLGPQLEGMRGWITHMQASPHAAIVDLGGRVAAKVAKADDAIKNTATAEQKVRTFRLTGARRQLIDEFNALRKSTEGALQQMPHAHPELKLPGNFAERFFRAERPTSPSKPPTVADLKVQLEAAKASVADLQAAYDAALQAEADEADAKAQADAEQKALAEAEAELKKQAEKVAELRAKLGKP